MERIARIKHLTPSEDINPGAGIATFPAESHHKLISWVKEGDSFRKVDHVSISLHYYNTSECVERLLLPQRNA